MGIGQRNRPSTTQVGNRFPETRSLIISGYCPSKKVTFLGNHKNFAFFSQRNNLIAHTIKKGVSPVLLVSIISFHPAYNRK